MSKGHRLKPGVFNAKVMSGKVNNSEILAIAAKLG